MFLFPLLRLKSSLSKVEAVYLIPRKFGPKMKYIPNAMKFGNKSRSSLLIINMIFEIVDLDPKLKTWADLVSKLQCARFL